MSLQIVTVKEIEKERNTRYDTSDRRVVHKLIDLCRHILIVSRLTYR